MDDVSLVFDKGYVIEKQYEVVGLVGSGGFGNVYLVKDLKFKIDGKNNKLFAAKQMMKDPAMRSDIPVISIYTQREAQTLALLSHPHLPRAEKFFKYKDYDLMVMEYIEGVDLFEYMAQRAEAGKGPFIPVLQAVRIGRQIAGTLAYLHDQKIIFRDVKPNNIMITQAFKSYLVDFSLHRLYKGGQKCDTFRRGQPFYAPPELFAATRGETDGRSDIYMLGATLYTILTGMMFEPFKVPEIDKLPGDQALPPTLRELIRRMTALKREDRPDNMYKVKRALELIERQILGLDRRGLGKPASGKVPSNV